MSCNWSIACYAAQKQNAVTTYFSRQQLLTLALYQKDKKAVTAYFLSKKF